MQREVQHAWIIDAAIRPKPGLAGNEGIAGYAVLHHHDPIVRGLEEYFPRRLRPGDVYPPSCRNERFASRTRKRPDIDFVDARLIGTVGDPASVGRKRGD